MIIPKRHQTKRTPLNSYENTSELDSMPVPRNKFPLEPAAKKKQRDVSSETSYLENWIPDR